MDINKEGSNKACASCKYQRRKCTKECPLAPYFPINKSKSFINVHRLFGVCYILKLLNRIDDDKKDEAMTSIIFESNIRAKFPIHGCVGVINILQEEVMKTNCGDVDAPSATEEFNAQHPLNMQQDAPKSSLGLTDQDL
ncbi:LOB domain-containing protein 27-like [Cicer arietinum]|uniref:LOB domain-containing protein 27-like n=1 Tax=Cicer arietinum TaxID=3827 RepID=A0A3Q7XU31_CICAR|nr:LOB domain-containing protein 27-like [Cicer arietinum]